MVPEPSDLPEPEDIPIPDADDLVNDILHQMVDFDESLTDVLQIFAVTGVENKHVDVDERKMTDEDRKPFRRAKAAGLQSWLDRSL